MLILVTYDVNTVDSGGAKRLRHVAKICEDYGQRVQNSVFECVVDESQYCLLKSKLIDKIDEKKDSLRLYRLGNRYKGKVEHFGTKKVIDQEGVLMF